MRIGALVLTSLGLLAVTGCASLQAPPEPAPTFQDGPVCTFEDVEFRGDFEGGRLSACRQEEAARYALYFRPEDTPINPSSWYAFSVETESPEALEITLNYVYGRHRYIPRISTDGGANWTEIEIPEDADSKEVLIRLAPNTGRVLIAGQPLFNYDRYDAWMTRLDSREDVERETIGQSEHGRDIEALSFGVPGAPVLLLIGRQHPPEITGALGMEAFVERLLEADPLAVRFRQNFRVELIPLMNPDGVALGQWRHNTRGVDLNRDWGPFTQAETRAARDWMAGFGEIVLALDFHSTWYDVLYTQPDDVPGVRADFPGKFADALALQFGERAPRRDAAHNPDSPTSKSWIHETYLIPAITYEVGDQTPLSDIIEIARGAAEATMRLLLEEIE